MKIVKFKTVFFIEIYLIILYKISESLGYAQGIDFWKNWLFILTLGFGIFTAIYALNLRCQACHSGQVFRGISFFSIRWPSKNCYKCDESLP